MSQNTADCSILSHPTIHTWKYIQNAIMEKAEMHKHTQTLYMHLSYMAPHTVHPPWLSFSYKYIKSHACRQHTVPREKEHMSTDITHYFIDKKRKLQTLPMTIAVG